MRLLILAVALALAGHANAASVPATPATPLAALLKTLRPYDHVALAPGAYAPSLYALDLPHVVIESADPAQPAVLSGCSLNKVSGLALQGLELDYSTATRARPCIVQDSADVHFRSVKVHGRPADGVGIWITGSRDVTVTGSEFYDLWEAVDDDGNDRVTLADNDVHGMRSDGFDHHGSSQWVVAANWFHDFAMSPGAHPDANQNWTSNTSKATRGHYFLNNLAVRAGGTAMQCDFERDEVGNLAPTRIVIAGNGCFGTMWNGLTVSGGAEVTIADNLVAGYAPPDMFSAIRLDTVSGLTLQGNTAQVWQIAPAGQPSAYSLAVPAGNVSTPALIDAARALLAQRIQH